MKRITLTIFFIIACVIYADGADKKEQNQEFPYKLAIDAALNNMQESIKKAPFAKQSVAILLPEKQFKGILNKEQSTYLAGRISNILIQSGYNLILEEDDSALKSAVEKLLNSDKKDSKAGQGDGKDEKKFNLGKLTEAQVLLYCSIDDLGEYAGYRCAEMTVYAADVLSSKLVWGGTFYGRESINNEVVGVIELDKDLRGLLKDIYEEAEKSLQEPAVQAKLGEIKLVSVLPINGDIDQYASVLSYELISKQQNLRAISPNIPTLAMACRNYGATGNQVADSVFWGILREISEKDVARIIDEDKYTATKTVLKRAEIQMSIIDIATRSILWSRTIAKEKEVSSAPEKLTSEEINEIDARKKEKASQEKARLEAEKSKAEAKIAAEEAAKAAEETALAAKRADKAAANAKLMKLGIVLFVILGIVMIIVVRGLFIVFKRR